MNNNGSVCTDRRKKIIGGIIDVPNQGDGGGGSTHYDCGGETSSGDGDDSTCKSELTWDDRHQEPPTTVDQLQPQTLNSRGTTRHLHPFPWSTSNESDIAPENFHIEVEHTEYGFRATDAAVNDETDRPLHRSSLVANESSLDGKSMSLLQTLLR
jgi:hypothetical protein